MTTTLGGITFDDGEVQRVEISKVANMIVFDMPFADSDEAQAYNWGGNVRRFTLTGDVHEANYAACQTRYNQIMALMSSTQSNITFSTELETGISVKVESARCWLDTTRPIGHFAFEINLVESG